MHRLALRLPSCIFTFLLAGLIASAVARADERSERSLRAPAREPAGFTLDELARITGGAILASPQDAAAAPAGAEGTPQEPPESSPVTSGWTIGGYIQASYTWNVNRPDNNPLVDTDGDGTPDTQLGLYEGGSKENLGRVFDTEHNDILLQQAVLEVTKAATEDSWVGVGVKVLAGHDAKLIHTPGLNDGDDFDLLNAYMAIYIPDAVKILGGGTFKIGKWETLVGAEVIDPRGNANYSRSYSFGFAIPFAHVGALYSKPLVKDGDTTLVGLDIGVTNSAAGRAEDNNDGKAGIGRVFLKPCDFFDIAVAAVVGNEPTATSNEADTRAIVDVVSNVSLPAAITDNAEFLKPLKFLLNFDYGGQESGAATGGSAKWSGFSGIARYDVNDQWYVALRGEVYRDADGFTIGLTDVDGDIAKDFMEVTLTAGYKPWSNFLVRAEYRYDKADQDVFSDNSGDDLRSFQNTVAFDAIVTF